MEIYAEKASPATSAQPLVAIGHFEDADGPSTALAAIDEVLGGAVARVLEAGDFRGISGEVRVLYAPPDSPGPERLLLVGLGKRADFDAESLRRCVGKASVTASELRTGQIAFALPFAEGLPITDQVRALVEASMLALYRFDSYLSKPPENVVPVERLTLVQDDDDAEADVATAISTARIAAECAMLCRDLGNTPAWDANPTWMAEQAQGIAEEVGLDVKVIEQPEMEELGMGGILGVSRGSQQPPRLVVLEHNAGRDDLDTICLVGKGVTFDTGGISLKPADKMHEMKYDKCGACAVIAAMRAVALLDLPIHVVGITPLVENMPGGEAYRPGDVLKCANGKTIEVLNTDAEGRLILADALWYATRYEPDAIVDLATLTGACMIALGAHYAGVMSENGPLVRQLVTAGEASGERVWRLPLGPDYREQIKSMIADMTNLGGRMGGAITAGALLAEFVDDYPWAHIDIAGVSWRDTDRNYQKKGGTGFGVRLLVEFLMNWKSGEAQ